MAKTIYRREKLEPELGHVGAQNFMSKQALIPDEHDTTNQQFESLAKSE